MDLKQKFCVDCRWYDSPELTKEQERSFNDYAPHRCRSPKNYIDGPKIEYDCVNGRQLIDRGEILWNCWVARGSLEGLHKFSSFESIKETCGSDANWFEVKTRIGDK